MAAATPYIRVPVVIFAVLIGGLYVYAKGGGSLLSKRPQVTPAANPQGEALAPPRIEFMMGPKSAPAFDKAPTYQSPPPPQQKSQSAPQKPAPRSEPAANQVPPPARVLPGSKSMILIDPRTISPTPTNAKPQPRVQQSVQQVKPTPQSEYQPAPRSRVLPGSKSAILIEPSAIVPPPNNLGNSPQVQRQPVYRQPANQQQSYQPPARGSERPYAPNGNLQQRGISR